MEKSAPRSRFTVVCVMSPSERIRKLMFWALAGIWNALEVIVPLVEA